METGSATPFICSKLIIAPINVTMTRSSNNTSHHALSVHPLPGPKGTEPGKARCCLHGPRALDTERRVNGVVILRWEKGWAETGAKCLRKESRGAFQEVASELRSRGSTSMSPQLLQRTGVPSFLSMFLSKPLLVSRQQFSVLFSLFFN